MRRIIMLVAVALVMAAMMVAMAMPAFAAAKGSANCVGREASVGEAGGQSTSTEARIAGGLGQLASTDCARV